jgi:hypothetical protein
MQIDLISFDAFDDDIPAWEIAVNDEALAARFGFHTPRAE